MENYLSAESIWSANDIQESEVDVPDWGGKVKIRGLTLEQMSTLATRVTHRNVRTGQDEIDRELSVALTLIYGMVEPQLTEADAAKLSTKSAAAVTRIVQAINALGPTTEAIEAATKSNAPERNGSIPVLPGAGASSDAG